MATTSTGLQATVHIQSGTASSSSSSSGSASSSSSTAPKPASAPASSGTSSSGASSSAPKPASSTGSTASGAAAAAAKPPEQAHSTITLVTAPELHAVMPHLATAKVTAYLPPLNQAMAEFQINSRLRICAFLGQIAEESGELAWFHEFASGMEYDITKNPKLAKGLGNTTPGDGPKYKGRGPIQLTGKNNYIACGKALGIDLVDNPDIAVQPSIAFRTAGWFWSKHGLNALADASNFREITHRINGGYNGYTARLAYYNKALTVFPATPAPAHPSATPAATHA